MTIAGAAPSVVIVGAGIVGAAIAHRLARAGAAVTMIDRAGPGAGATGRSFSSYDTIIESIRTKLLTLPDDTVVHTGHGDTTTIGAEAPDLA